jgi:hypothetical protein
MRVLIFSTAFSLNISHSKKNWARYDKTVHRSACKVLVILVRFEIKLNFLNPVSKYPQISNLMTIRSVGAELLHADGRTDWIDMAKPVVAFRKFGNSPNKSLVCLFVCLFPWASAASHGCTAACWLIVPTAFDVPTLATRCPRAYRRVPHSGGGCWNIRVGIRTDNFA